VHNDFAFIALTILFFAGACGLTVACDRIIGPDPVEATMEDETSPERQAA
jgi:hypothetical protein